MTRDESGGASGCHAGWVLGVWLLVGGVVLVVAAVAVGWWTSRADSLGELRIDAERIQYRFDFPSRSFVVWPSSTEVARMAVCSARVEEHPSRLHKGQTIVGWGAMWFGGLLVGRFRRFGGARQLWAARSRQRAVVLELDPTCGWDRFVVDVADPDDVVAQLSRRPHSETERW